MEGHLDVVKMLVERGAEFQGTWNGENALTDAITYDQKEIEEYLRSKGAVEPVESAAPSQPVESTPALDHARAHFGEVHPLAFRDILPLEKAIIVRAAKAKDCLILFTDGMSNEPAGFPGVPDAEQYAELMICLPPDWPLSQQMLQNPDSAWPVSVLRRVAHSPLENTRMLEPGAFLYSPAEPPTPLAPNTKLSCALARKEEGERGQFSLPHGQPGAFYCFWPLYTEERDLCLQFGVNAVMKLFKNLKVSRIVDPRRRNAAIDK
jgi:hypothetical protein